MKLFHEGTEWYNKIVARYNGSMHNCLYLLQWRNRRRGTGRGRGQSAPKTSDWEISGKIRKNDFVPSEIYYSYVPDLL